MTNQDYRRNTHPDTDEFPPVGEYGDFRYEGDYIDHDPYEGQDYQYSEDDTRQFFPRYEPSPYDATPPPSNRGFSFGSNALKAKRYSTWVMILSVVGMVTVLPWELLVVTFILGFVIRIKANRDHKKWLQQDRINAAHMFHGVPPEQFY